jgi:hypothetical protein
MNEYMIQNSTGSPILAEVLGLTVAGKGKSRVLTLAECKLVWANGLPSGLSLVPVLMESRAPKEKVVEPETTKAPRGKKGESE